MEFVDEAARSGMTSFLCYSRCLSHKLHDEMEALVSGDIELNKDGLDVVGRTLAQVGKQPVQESMSRMRRGRLREYFIRPRAGTGVCATSAQCQCRPTGAHPDFA